MSVAVCFVGCSGWLNNHLSHGISPMKFCQKWAFALLQWHSGIMPPSALSIKGLHWFTFSSCPHFGCVYGVWKCGGHHCWLLWLQEGVPSPSTVGMEAGHTAQALVVLASAAGRQKPIHWCGRCSSSVWDVTLCWKTRCHFNYSSPLIWCWVFLQWGQKWRTCPFLSVLARACAGLGPAMLVARGGTAALLFSSFMGI